jgi:hypothetical protein
MLSAQETTPVLADPSSTNMSHIGAKRRFRTSAVTFFCRRADVPPVATIVRAERTFKRINR